MSLLGVERALAADPAFAQVLAQAPTRGEVDVVAPVGVRAPLLVELARERPVVVVLHGEALGDRDARDALAAALASAHEKGTAVLVGTTGAGAPDLLPGAPTLDVSAPPVEPVATTPPDDTEVVSTSSTTGAGSVDDTEVSL